MEEVEEEMDSPTIVHFNERQYQNLKDKLNVEEHYLISYGKDLCYIGKVIELKKQSIEVKFMERQPGDMYIWKVNKKNIEEVKPEQFVSGPLRLHGTMPYNIKGVETAHRAYIKYIKQLQSA